MADKEGNADINGSNEKQDEYLDGGSGRNSANVKEGEKEEKEKDEKRGAESPKNDGNEEGKEAGDEDEGKDPEQEEDLEKELAREDVCRDFLNNMCNRGSRCKFYHPPSIVRQRAAQQAPEGIEYQFCIDYQNRGCHRDNCRFIHAHREDVERYKMTGEVSLNLAREIAAVYNCDTINGIPFCKEYQTGSCSRGGQRCRYWHINVEEERERRRRIPRGLSASAMPPPPLSRARGLDLHFGRRSHPYGAFDDYAGGAYGKRIRYERYDPDEEYIRELERRNAELSKEVEGLKRELMRERERYEDLYTLFRQRTSTATTQQDPATTVPAATTAYYQAAPTTGWTDTQWTQ